MKGQRKSTAVGWGSILRTSILALIMVLGATLAACTGSTKVQGALERIDSSAKQIIVLTPEGDTVSARFDSGTKFKKKDGREVTMVDIAPGSLVTMTFKNDLATLLQDDDDEEDDEDNGLTPPSTVLIDGADLYFSMCTSCHNGTTPFTTWRTDLSNDQMTFAIRFGPGRMPEFDTMLTSAQIAAIVSYIRAAPSPGIDATSVYSRNCASCHGADRQGGRGPAIRPSDLTGFSVSQLTSFLTNHFSGRDIDAAQRAVLVNSLKGISPTAPPATIVPPTVTAPPATTLPGVDTANLYLASCSGCHGDNRAGTAIGPNITPTSSGVSNRTTAQLSNFLSGHRSGANLTGTQATALAGFLKNPSTTPPPVTTAPPATTPPPAANGATLYAASCAFCHGDNRTGTNLGPNVTPTAGGVSGRTAAQLSAFIGGHNTGSVMTAAQTTALADFLKNPTAVPPPATTTPPPTTLPPVVSGIDSTLVYLSKCATCHGNNREGRVGPPIAVANLTAFTPTQLSAFISVHFTGVGMDPRIIDALVVELKGGAPPPVPPPVTTAPPPTTIVPPPTTPAINAALLYTNNCAVCHGANRTGTSLGPNISINSNAVTGRSETQLSSFIGGHRTGSNLSVAERAALANYLKTVP